MIRIRDLAATMALGAFSGLGAMTLAALPAGAGDAVYVQQVADRCARLGQGLFDLGNGFCGRVSGRIRVTGTNNAAMNNWGASGTSNAAMRSTEPSMLPGAEISRRLRVRGNLDTASPFR